MAKTTGTRWLAAAFLMLLLAWVLVGFTESELGDLYPGLGASYLPSAIVRWEALLNAVGYVALPSTLALALILACAYSDGVYRLILKRRLYLVVLAVAGVSYAALYAYSTGMVQFVSLPSGTSNAVPAFAVGGAAFGPLALWPDIDYWLPAVFPASGVEGFVSLGTGMILIAISFLMGLNAVLFYMKVKSFRGRSCGAAATVGALVSSLATRFCCSPGLILPLLTLFAGYGFASYVSSQLNPTSPFFNVIIVLNLSLLVTGTYLFAKDGRLSGSSWSCGQPESRSDKSQLSSSR